MNLTFIKSNDRWLAEFKVSAEFNLHIEGVKQGNISLFQRTIENGAYAYISNAVPTPTSGIIYDSDFSATIYPKYIRVSCATEPTMAVVTSGGEITPIKIKGDIPDPGVYVQHINGEYFTSEEWTAGGYSNDQANGVIVATEEHRFVIAKENVGQNSLMWSSDATNAVDGIVLTSNKAEAKKDYNGKANTQLMLATDTSGAAYACANYIFPNGQKGYLPSLGELIAAFNNKTAIDEAMSVLGSAPFYGFVWSSTQYANHLAWYITWSDGMTNSHNKASNDTAVPFTTL